MRISPEELTRAAVWHEPNERERMFLEHGLIYTFRPVMNDDLDNHHLNRGDFHVHLIIENESQLRLGCEKHLLIFTYPIN